MKNFILWSGVKDQICKMSSAWTKALLKKKKKTESMAIMFSALRKIFLECWKIQYENYYYPKTGRNFRKPGIHTYLRTHWLWWMEMFFCCNYLWLLFIIILSAQSIPYRISEFLILKPKHSPFELGNGSLIPGQPWKRIDKTFLVRT